MILTTVAIAFVAFIAFGLFKASELKSLQIVKSVTVKGSKEEVFNMVRFKDLGKVSLYFG